LAFTTVDDTHPSGSPEVALDALMAVARLGSRFELIDEDGVVTRRVLVDDNGGQR
jgi:hypothetical protein